jgi:hypothetical protein
MENLDKVYVDHLDKIAQSIQASELLEAYLEDEEPELYKKLSDTYEPFIHELYQAVADDHPMQIYALEEKIMDPAFEGLYLQRLLGYSVLRGVVNAHYKYIMPQDQFRKVLMAICQSANFELISHRIGQTVQVGFALSSDVWISNFFNEITNKKIKQFLMSQRLPKYRELNERRIGYLKYKKQFGTYNFYTARFPKTFSEMHTLYPELKEFLVQRILLNKDDSNLYPYIEEFAGNKDLRGEEEFVYTIGLMANYFDDEGAMTESIKDAMNEQRKEDPTFVTTYFEFLRELLNSKIPVSAECDHRLSRMIDKSIKDDFTKYYNLTDIIHSKGYVHEDTIEAIQKFYYQHEGLSTINECVRMTILNYFAQILRNLDEESYTDYFELNKIFTRYINIFTNQQFNQSVKELSLEYIKRLKKRYTDKRGKDYQDIKKFVMTTFVDLGFMNEKEVAEVFKTRRKKRKQASA